MTYNDKDKKRAYAARYAAILDKAAARAWAADAEGAAATWPKICIYAASPAEAYVADFYGAYYDAAADALHLIEYGNGLMLSIYDFADTLDRSQEQDAGDDFPRAEIYGTTAGAGIIPIHAAFSLLDY